MHLAHGLSTKKATKIETGFRRGSFELQEQAPIWYLPEGSHTPGLQPPNRRCCCCLRLQKPTCHTCWPSTPTLGSGSTCSHEQAYFRHFLKQPWYLHPLTWTVFSLPSTCEVKTQILESFANYSSPYQHLFPLNSHSEEKSYSSLILYESVLSCLD